MVALGNISKTSSIAAQSGKREYSFVTSIETDWHLPDKASIRIEGLPKNVENSARPRGGYWNEATGGHESSQDVFRWKTASYIIAGNFTGKPADPTRWKDPPHRFFLNLPVLVTKEQRTEVLDSKAMILFTRSYAPLAVSPAGEFTFRTKKGTWKQVVQSSPNLDQIQESVRTHGKPYLEAIAARHSQALLKFIWRTGDRTAIEVISKEVERSLRTRVSADGVHLVVGVRNMWILICMLILRDNASGRLGICQNPDCPAPYFLKSRKTQKICEAGSCVAWAQRKYALKWWRDHESKASKAKR